MISKKESPDYRKWLIFNTCGLLLIMFASTAAPVAPYNWEGFYNFAYKVLAILLSASYIYFNLKGDKPEIRLVMYYCLWLVISRILNGDIILSRDGMAVLNIWVSCLFLPLLMIIEPERRLKVMDTIAILLGIFFSVAAIIGIYTALTRNMIVNPLSQWFICTVEEGRIYIFGSNPNVTGNWMFTGVFLFIYLFMRHRNIFLRILYVTGAVLSYVALALTVSRNSMVGFSVSFAVFIALVAIRLLKTENNWLKSGILLICLCFFIPLVYSSFGFTTHKIGVAANEIINGSAAEEKAEARYQNMQRFEYAQPVTLRAVAKPVNETDDEKTGANMYDDDRGFKDSGRLPAYKHAITSIIEQPSRLIRGSLNDDVVKILNNHSTESGKGRIYGHFHNSFIQTLEFTGLPGLLLTLGFWILLVIRALRLFYSNDPRANMAIKSLVLTLPGYLVYNMLETSAFSIMDFRSMFFFLISGAVIAFSYEICPPKGKIV